MTDRTDIPWPTTKTPILDDAGRTASREATLARRPAGPVWVFAYGSLIWNPGFQPVGTRHAVLHNFHRSFCFWTMVARGTPERPGLGLALEAKSGALCRGVALQIDPETEAADLEALWAREMFSGVYRPTWVPLDCAGEASSGEASSGKDGDPIEPAITALTFVADPDHAQYCPPLTQEQKAWIIAGAAGQFGPCIEYVENVVRHLEAAGEPDPELAALLKAAQAAL